MKALRIAMMLVGLTTGLFALRDSPENRTRLAERYVQIVRPQNVSVSVFERALPANRRDLTISIMRHMNMRMGIEAILHTLIENYTVYEIQALTDFYSSPLGRSYLQNLGAFESAEALRAARFF